MVNYDMLLNYYKKIAGKYGIKVGNVQKLVRHLGNKRNYLVHCKDLHMYLSLGIKLNKIHKDFKFKKSDWLKNYIDFSTVKRKKLLLIFLKKTFFKLMINCAYGKTMENLRTRINLKLLNNEQDYLKHVYQSTFISQKIFDKNFATILKIKLVLILNKPIFVGFTVLELSKWLIYDFHINFIYQKKI